jgi:hypothetical protein
MLMASKVSYFSSACFNGRPAQDGVDGDVGTQSNTKDGGGIIGGGNIGQMVMDDGSELPIY